MTVMKLLQNLKEGESCYRATGVVLNNEVALQAMKILEQKQVKPSAPICVIEDQVVPANAPEVSEAQQYRAKFSREIGCSYIYGQTMASHYLVKNARAGQLFVSGDKDVAMVGAVGALGIAVEPQVLAEVMETGLLKLPELKGLKVRITGALPAESDGRAAAVYMVACLKALVDEATVIEFIEEAGGLDLETKQMLCGWTQKLGVLSALFASKDEAESLVETVLDGASVDGVGDKSCVLELNKVPALLEQLPEQTVNAVFIGGAYGGTLEAIRQVAEAVKGQKVAYKLRLSVAPASAEIYVAAANAGYLAAIIQAEGMVLNQCAAPPVQARIGEGEVMVTNDIHDQPDYAGEGGKIYLASTQQAIKAALTGRLGGKD